MTRLGVFALKQVHYVNFTHSLTYGLSCMFEHFSIFSKNQEMHITYKEMVSYYVCQCFSASASLSLKVVFLALVGGRANMLLCVCRGEAVCLFHV